MTNKKLKFNPFHDSGITTFEQFNLYPFIVFGSLDVIQNRVQQQINQLKGGYEFGDRLIILGERGIGKTSALFFIKKMLDKEGIRTELFSRLIEDQGHLEHLMTKIVGNPLSSNRIERTETLAQMTSKPIYFLIDFPDAVDAKSFRKFMEFLWTLMIHPNYNRINLILSMNRSHYDKSFDNYETFGKFATIRLERLTTQESTDLISSRLSKVDETIEGIFEDYVLEVIFNYAKGIPRNIISACSLLIENSNGKKITKEFAEKILKERYLDQVINDRVEDLDLRRIFRQMTKILEQDFNGVAKSQEEYVKKVMDACNIGRNSALARIADLVKFGIFNQYKGGYNRVNKIISFN